jgi:archaellum component FlaD/FlaE
MKKHVASRRHPQQRRKPDRRLQVQNNSQLAFVHPEKRSRLAMQGRGILAKIIAFRRLDFYNFRAQIRQQRTAVLTSDIRTQILHPDPGKRPRKLNSHQYS